ncbi:MAG: glycine cleavage system protein GcvH [Lentisphaeria bacterium]|nr:MAG: glycine cleavage system protein GcvH [Lentisphaeria bacterium]
MKYYTEDHEWVEIVGDEATVGISEYAADELGDITYVELPEEEDDFIIGDRLGEVESVNSSSDIYSPISGTVSQVNEALTDEPGLINESPEEKGWLCRLINFDSSELDDMMNEDAYHKYLRKLNR